MQGGCPYCLTGSWSSEPRGWFQSLCRQRVDPHQLLALPPLGRELSAFPSSPRAELGIWAWAHPANIPIGSGTGRAPQVPGMALLVSKGFSLKHRVPPTPGASLAGSRRRAGGGGILPWCMVGARRPPGAWSALRALGQRGPELTWPSPMPGHNTEAGQGLRLTQPRRGPDQGSRANAAPISAPAAAAAPGWCPTRPWRPCCWFMSPLCWPPRRKPSFPSSPIASSRRCR